MGKSTSMTLGRHFETFIRKQVASGRFGTASEVVRAALRNLEEEETKLTALRSALEAGESSGFAEEYTLEGVLAELNRE
jgi:antitoxin ParD1/3/4